MSIALRSRDATYMERIAIKTKTSIHQCLHHTSDRTSPRVPYSSSVAYPSF